MSGLEYEEFRMLLQMERRRDGEMEKRRGGETEKRRDGEKVEGLNKKLS